MKTRKGGKKCDEGNNERDTSCKEACNELDRSSARLHHQRNERINTDINRIHGNIQTRTKTLVTENERAKVSNVHDNLIKLIN
jgi:galactokinase